MANTKKYADIPVTLAIGEEKNFNFEVEEHGESGQFARITTGNHMLVIDEELAYLEGDMPVEWRPPAIAKLLLLIKANNHQDAS